MLDENEFLSPYGIRAISRYHKNNPYVLQVNGTQHRVDYEPAESSTGLFGGNSNWRGPIWFPLNYLIIESLQKFHHYHGKDFKVECPTGSGQMMTLGQWQPRSRGGYRASSCGIRLGGGQCLERQKSFRPIQTGAISFRSTNTFMAITVPA